MRTAPSLLQVEAVVDAGPDPEPERGPDPGFDPTPEAGPED